ncbi:NAD(P)/FAD-dependent oxidoreductase [soil metagenome]
MESADLTPQKDAPAVPVENPAVYEAIIVGGGPAGLSAALILGRCRRKVLVIDAGKPRNRFAKHMHGYLTRDCIPPADFYREAREQLAAYPNVELMDGSVNGCAKECDFCDFSVELSDGRKFYCSRLLIATGVSDELPEIENFAQFYGSSVHHCPYCDGWEWRDAPVAVYGCGDKAFGTAQEITAWTRDIVIVTDGPCTFTAEQREFLTALEIGIREEPIGRLEGEGDQLQRIVFTDGSHIDRRAMFFNTGHKQGCDMFDKLGCRMTEKGCVWTDDYANTSVSGLYCAGDSSKNAQMVIVAAAEGALAAVAINKSLTKQFKENKGKGDGV